MDNPVIRKMLCRLFAIEEDYDICAEAENGLEAIELALHRRPDPIILDWGMPVLNGLETAQELKKIMPDVPIILFTQHAHASKGLSGFQMFVDRIVAKIDAMALIEHVKAPAPI